MDSVTRVRLLAKTMRAVQRDFSVAVAQLEDDIKAGRITVNHSAQPEEAQRVEDSSAREVHV